MKQIWKTVVSALLSMVLVFSGVDTGIFVYAEEVEESEAVKPFGAGENTEQSGDFGTNLHWSFADGTLTISGTGAIPDYTLDYGSEGAEPPWAKKVVERVVIEDGVTRVGKNAFSYSDCKSVTLPSSVGEIRDEAFRQCDALKEVSLSEGLWGIGAYAFAECGRLEKLSLPNSLSTLDAYAFSTCAALKEVRIPYCRSVGAHAFENCNSLETVTFSEDVISIGAYAFSNCSNLKSVAFPEELQNVGAHAFEGDESLEEIILPSAVTIGEYAFSQCGSYSTTGEPIRVSLPQNLTKIGRGAFFGCVMEEIILPEKLRSIGNEAFSVAGLTSITIPASVLDLGMDEIIYDENGNVTEEIDADPRSVFDGAYLENIRVASGNPIYDSRDNANAIIRTADNTLLLGCKSTVIPDTVTSIGSLAFYDCQELKKINIPKSVTNIEIAAFSRSGLTEIEIPESVKEIGGLAFDCPSLTDAVLDEGIETIGERAFAGMMSPTGLIRITLPKSLRKIDNAAFYGCVNLTDVYYAGSEADWAKVSINTDGALGATTGNGNQRLLSAKMHYNYDTTIHVTSVSVTPTTLALKLGATESGTLTATVTPNNATDASVTWSSENPAIAKVDASGNVTAVSEGTTNITVTTTDGNKSAVCAVTIEKAGEEPDPEPTPEPEPDPTPEPEPEPEPDPTPSDEDGTSDRYDDETEAVEDNPTETGFSITGIAASYTYTGAAIKPVPHVYYNGSRLTNGTDYTVGYKNNTNAAGSTGASAPTITVKLKGNYSGTATATFTIAKRDISMVAANDISALVKSKTKSGTTTYTAQKLVPTLSYNGKALKNGKDFTLTYTTGTNDYAAPGTYTIAVAGTGNFTGSTSVTETIVASGATNLSTVKVALASGEKITAYNPVSPVSQTPQYVLTDKKTGKALTKGTDYTVTYTNNRNPGTATVIFTAAADGSYYGSKKMTFKIAKAAKQSVTDTKSISVALSETSLTYEKGGVTPAVTVTDTRYDEAGRVLTAGIDYTVKYTNFNAANGSKSPTVTITGKGDYSGKRPVTYAITKSDITENADILVIADDFAYKNSNGAYKKTKVTVIDSNGKALDKKDFSVKSWSASSEKPAVGETVSVTVEGKGNYSGTKTATFLVVDGSKKISSVKATPKSSADLTYDSSKKGFVFDGEAVTPTAENLTVTAKVKENGKSVTKTLTYGSDEDYVIVGYQNNTKTGTAKLTIRGVNDYAGTATISYKIVQKKAN